MLSPWDESYQKTKAIKTGATSLQTPFKEMVAWVNETYHGVGAIDAWFDRPDSVRKNPALRIVLEREAAAARFDLRPFKYNPTEQQRVASHFTQLLARLSMHEFETQGLFVTFHAFEDTARWDANMKVNAEDLAHFELALRDLGVWKVYPNFSEVTFFFLTDDQLQASKTNGARKVCENGYASILSRYDEFGYYRKRPIEASFYSKESFDRNFHGNWFYFDRRGRLFDREDQRTWGQVRRNAACPCGSGKRFKHCHGAGA